MAAVMIHVIPGFYAKYPKNNVCFCRYVWNINCDYCNTHQDAEVCFLPVCRYHILFLGNVEELLQKLDPFCFTYEQVECLSTLIKCRFSGNIVVTNGQVFNNVQRTVCFFFRQTGEWTKSSASRKRISWGKSVECIYWAPAKSQNQRKQVDQSLQKKMNDFERQNKNRK